MHMHSSDEKSQDTSSYLQSLKHSTPLKMAICLTRGQGYYVIYSVQHSQILKQCLACLTLGSCAQNIFFESVIVSGTTPLPLSYWLPWGWKQ